MAVDENESAWEKIKDFWWQKPNDHSYEDEGGDDRVPEKERTNDPKADANKFARENGEEPPYPEYVNPTEADTKGTPEHPQT